MPRREPGKPPKAPSYPQPVPKTGRAGQEARDEAAIRTGKIHDNVKPT